MPGFLVHNIDTYGYQARVWHMAAPSASAVFPVHTTGIGHFVGDDGFEHHKCRQSIPSLHLVIRGRGAFTIEGTRYETEPGTALIFWPGREIHYQAQGPGWEYIFVWLAGSGVEQMLATIGLSPDAPARQLPWSDAVSTIFAELLHTLTTGTSHDFSSVCIVTDLMGRLASAQKHPTSAPQDWLAADCKKAIDGHSTGSHDVDYLARQFNVSRWTLQRRFKQAWGMSPKAYIEQSRLDRAWRMLRESHLSISEVAQQCGYSDPNYFSRRFASRHGFAPSQCRGYVDEPTVG